MSTQAVRIRLDDSPDAMDQPARDRQTIRVKRLRVLFPSHSQGSKGRMAAALCCSLSRMAVER
jgi:hypothetical protein